MAAAAKGRQSLQPSAPEDAVGEDDADAELIEHSFVLRPELTISIELPVDPSRIEAGRFAAFIQSLPFGEEG